MAEGAKVAIAYHSGYGHTKIVADEIAKGLVEAGAEAHVWTVEEIGEDLDRFDDVDGIIFGSPTYMGGPSGPFKTFADLTSKKWFVSGWADKLAAGFSTSGSLSGDKHMTLMYFATLSMQHKMIWVGQGEGAPGTESGHGGKPEDVNRVGSFLGLMTQSDNAPAENTPSPGDIETARRFGVRFGEAAARWKRGV